MTLYLSVPIFSVYVIASEKNLNRILEWQSYVVYPPEGPRPPDGEEMLEMLERESAKKKETQ
eukprot:CAMPEP_0182444492 /NCGR_PEP_ID=MMETSP1172-20130603/2928_1 /TAXON_ID=708627 /ORGANISM="Timspurckia oligopyrenoides, Strain CCMP3278" /LENGTH=61 /DNA_ID=CAMNT_0024640057 /DNA_START=96 /DNA_END=281 /DNA_ORIENTATION=+